MIAIIDYKIGNIKSVSNMLCRLGIACTITSCADVIEQASHIILPGNGSFDACMNNFMASGLVPVLEKKVLLDKTPFLGICVGAQMLGMTSEEGQQPGLGWIPMSVKKFPDTSGYPVPHMGWNQTHSVKSHPLNKDDDLETRFYFSHSYYMDPLYSDNILYKTYYSVEFASAIVHDNIVGVQFHPEKSHRFGKNLLNLFGKI